MRKALIIASLTAVCAGAMPAVGNAAQRCVNPQNNTTTGALVGAAGGAAVGSVLAGRGSRGEGAVLGALGGALLGGAIGRSQTRCPEGYYAYDDQTRQYYDNDGRPYQPQGAYSPAGGPPPPPPGGAYDRPPESSYDRAPPPPPSYDRGPPPRYETSSTGGYGYYDNAPRSPRQRLEWASQRIDRMADSGRLNPREAESARSDLSDIRRQYAKLSRRGGGSLNGADRDYINSRLDRLAQNVRWDARDNY